MSRTSLVAAFLLAALGGQARAATDPPLPSALENPVVRGFHRVALAVTGGGAERVALNGRREVALALAAAGHEVVIFEGAVSLPPARDLLLTISKQTHAPVLIVVQAGADDPAAISMSMYDLFGSRLFDFSCRLLAPVAPIAPSAPLQPAPLHPAPLQPEPLRPIDLRALPPLDGPDLYRALGRPDLATSYERRRAVKTGLRVGGVLMLVGGVLWGLENLLALSFQAGASALLCVPSADTGSTSSVCQNPPSPSGIPWLVALGGLGMVVAPAFISTDPLSPAEKRSLLYGTTASLSVSIAPAPAADGATLVVGGQF